MTGLIAAVGTGARAVVAGAMRAGRLVTGLGWAVLLVGLVSLWLGQRFDWAEFLALAVVAACALLAAVPFVLIAPQYEVRIDLATDRVVVGEPAAGRIVVRNTAGRTSPAARVRLPVGRAQAEFAVPRLPAGAEHEELFTIPTQRRAVLTLGPVTSVRSDPLGLLHRVVDWTDPAELYVHPRVAVLGGDTMGLVRDLEGLPTRDMADDDVSFHTLREYVPGDDLRHIHWRSTLRTGEYMIRQYEQTRRSHLVIALSTCPADYASDDEFELAVSVAGSIGLAALRGDRALTMFTSTGTVPSPTPIRFLDALSGIDALELDGTSEPGDRGDVPGIDSIAQRAVVAAPHASVVIFITGIHAPVRQFRSASLRVPITVRSLGVRTALAAELARHTVGDFTFVDVPALDGLPRAIRAVTA